MLFLAIPELENTILETAPNHKTYKNAAIQATEIIRHFKNDKDANASIFLMQMGQGQSKRIFGGYASQSWNSEQIYFGDNSCFLFLMTQTEKIKLRENPNPPTEKRVYLWQNQYSLSFGQTDLVLNEDGTWTSEVDISYSSTKNLNAEERKTFLAGVHKFKPEIMEIWLLKPSPGNQGK